VLLKQEGGEAGEPVGKFRAAAFAREHAGIRYAPAVYDFVAIPLAASAAGAHPPGGGGVFRVGVGDQSADACAVGGEPHDRQQQGADAAATLALKDGRGELRFVGRGGIAPPTGGTDAGKLAGGIKDCPGGVALRLDGEDPIEHFFPDDLAGVGPEALVAGFRREAAVGLGEGGAVTRNERADQHGRAIAEGDVEGRGHWEQKLLVFSEQFSGKRKRVPREQKLLVFSEQFSGKRKKVPREQKLLVFSGQFSGKRKRVPRGRWEEDEMGDGAGRVQAVVRI
jgi:hypothetical protein